MFTLRTFYFLIRLFEFIGGGALVHNTSFKRTAPRRSPVCRIVRSPRKARSPIARGLTPLQEDVVLMGWDSGHWGGSGTAGGRWHSRRLQSSGGRALENPLPVWRGNERGLAGLRGARGRATGWGGRGGPGTARAEVSPWSHRRRGNHPAALCKWRGA